MRCKDKVNALEHLLNVRAWERDEFKGRWFAQLARVDKLEAFRLEVADAVHNDTSPTRTAQRVEAAVRELEGR